VPRGQRQRHAVDRASMRTTSSARPTAGLWRFGAMLFSVFNTKNRRGHAWPQDRPTGQAVLGFEASPKWFFLKNQRHRIEAPEPRCGPRALRPRVSMRGPQRVSGAALAAEHGRARGTGDSAYSCLPRVAPPRHADSACWQERHADPAGPRPRSVHRSYWRSRFAGRAPDAAQISRGRRAADRPRGLASVLLASAPRG
jgi:hypothetical protein